MILAALERAFASGTFSTGSLDSFMARGAFGGRTTCITRPPFGHGKPYFRALSSVTTIADTHRNQLTSALCMHKPYHGEGVHEFDRDALSLWFHSANGTPCRISLARNGTTSAELSTLFAACQPATFGRNAEDVLDESYRKAGKLDKSDFTINLDLVGSGLLDKVHDALFGWEATRRDIRAEVYKLNVYGPGSFFKAHKDTPRCENMFGSLVLSFPIAHEGGALMLRHDGRHAAHNPIETNYTTDNQVSWVTFFSDVEHEILPVTSGHRVTITYNLFHQQRPPAGTLAPFDTEPLLQVLERLLADPTFLPDGGRLGFGLSHQYPVPSIDKHGRIDTDLDTTPEHHNTVTPGLGQHDLPVQPILRRLQGQLKGQDAALFTAAQHLDLSPRLAMTYDSDCGSVFLLYTFWDGGHQVEDYEQLFEIEHDGELIERAWDQDDDDWRPEEPGEWMSRREKVASNGGPICWVTERTGAGGARFGTEYVAYGNESVVETMYADVVLVAKVPPAAARFAVSTAEPPSGA